LKRQNPFVFYPWHWAKTVKSAAVFAATYLRLHAIMRRIEADPNRFAWRDAAIAPIGANAGEDHLVASTRITDYARRRIANGVRARAGAAL
jgi:hypothetical protein